MRPNRANSQSGPLLEADEIIVKPFKVGRLADLVRGKTAGVILQRCLPSIFSPSEPGQLNHRGKRRQLNRSRRLKGKEFLARCRPIGWSFRMRLARMGWTSIPPYRASTGFPSELQHSRAGADSSFLERELSPQIRVITGNKRRAASFLETKASTTFNAASGVASSLETMTIGICGLRRFISVANSRPFISGM